ncbi:MAG: lipid-A-disaccharide synthase N-terminal domain-containing protein [Phycisphaerales bacterium]|nr:lipid-A-disaccharide synthase N-terminal domain-containing protein [Phycisphaerales bacterium]MCI0629074.1 lipid-A-disaccharide synthase N-terminal domain-containing protein [Phycisphaerales bacterium]MCI0675628.1 lipid-A-disaccharide synthase N-terminal domain-containing protein [Phycisphaerales bacterium]
MKRVVIAWIVVALLLAGAWFGLAWLSDTPASDPHHAVNIKVQLEDARDRANLIENPDGSHSYLLEGFDGTPETLTAEQFAARVYQQQRSRSLLGVLFNISSPTGLIWVSLGLLGQLLFTGRMIAQWLISEKEQQSVVPPIFWWLSFVGGLMLLAYFLWRRDIVGVLGQGFGVVIYARNLYFIHHGGNAPQPRTA